MRILVAYRTINNIAGGVERFSTSLMNEMVKRGHDIHFYTLDHADAVSFYKMNPAIKWHKMGLGNPQIKASWLTRIRRGMAGRKLIAKIDPDLILALQDGAFYQMRSYTAGLNLPIIFAERIGPSHFAQRNKKKNQDIAFRLYNFATHITVQCASYVEAYPENLQKKITVIPNPVPPATGQANPAGTPEGEKILLCVGRIGHQKNQSTLIAAFERIHADFPQWKLVLVGAADDDTELQNQITAAGLTEKIKCLGAVKDVAALYKEAHLFCLPSRWEGFPNALAEAMSYGLPAVGFAGCDGVRDLIDDGKTGLLAIGNGNTQTLGKALAALMADDQARANMGAAAAKAMKNYEPAPICDRWEKLFKDVINR